MADPVVQTFPLGHQWPTVDPFLFCVHHVDAYPPGNEVLGPDAPLDGRELGRDFEGRDGWRMYHGQQVPGFPQHPHRGFETVTYVRRGYIDHSDSLGATARFGRGDVQWLTAGRGIVHAETFPLVERDRPNPLELFQIWLNLAPEDKLADPHFSMLWADQLPTITHADAEGRQAVVTVVAGALEGHVPPSPPPRSWASRPSSDVAIWHVHLDAGASWTVPPAQSAATVRALYLFDGPSLEVAGHHVGARTGVVVEADQAVVLRAEGGADVLVLQGRPIGAPVAQYGPFVMNQRSEVEQAFADYQATGFGGWPWASDEPVHPAGETRFARRSPDEVEVPRL